MSVFKKLKGTFQNAQQDFVDGLRALTSLDGQPRHEQLKDIRARQINLDAGADLLHSYQRAWAEMQVETKDSARRAEEVRLMMLPMFKVWDEHTEIMARLEEEVRHIPNIVTSLQQSQDLLDALRKDFAVAEKAMDMLENLCEEMEQKDQCAKEMQKLSKYRNKKTMEAQKVKVELAQTHAKKMVELESAKRESLQERAEAFTSAFEQDVDYYKVHGHPDRVPTEFPKVTSLSDIEIESDRQELDCFLGSDTEPSDALELPEEGTYIEDDYTADFSVKEDDDRIDERDILGVHEQMTITNIDYDDDDEDDDDVDDDLRPEEVSSSQGRADDGEGHAEGRVEGDTQSSENTPHGKEGDAGGVDGNVDDAVGGGNVDGSGGAPRESDVASNSDDQTVVKDSGISGEAS
ncbi:dysbindin protein homolog [Aplysia californica]|uniref:Dysbindin protein homolog n=1 Tax=Aplysia californica TaxID=6500 RepID=A0ABM0K6M0_APLCA|nr:dysbindin protein homolog [Aplysia californica]